MKKQVYILAVLLFFAFVSCDHQEVESVKTLPLRKTEKGYEPVVNPISQDTFQQLFMTGGWGCVKEMAVYADGSIKDKEPLVGGMGILYTFADGKNVQRLFTVGYPREKISLSGAPYTYDEKNNTFAEFESSPVINHWIQYTIISINNEEMRMTRPSSSSDYVLDYYIFEHYSDETILEILHNEGVEGF